jgi:rhodanese-related sulfurtransferase
LVFLNPRGLPVYRRARGFLTAMNALAIAGIAGAARRLNRVSDVWLVIVLFVAAGSVGAVLVQYRHRHREFHPRITLAEMRAHVARGDALILDAREPGDFRAGHLPGALGLPANAWSRRSRDVEAMLREHRDRLVIVYCANSWCGQAEELQQALIADGHRRVGLFVEGFEAWRDAGDRVVTP